MVKTASNTRMRVQVPCHQADCGTARSHSHEPTHSYCMVLAAAARALRVSARLRLAACALTAEA